MGRWLWHLSGVWTFWIVLIFAFFVLLVPWLPNAGPGRERELLSEILKRRYTQGELDKEEYERKLAELRR